ncbi:hypothetical protein [uncultured Aquitalea sp.]|uniref:hypothetical protein n=1 Tax=uncultured Aquitalea sp. TaxID=540272 RepID=UPI0025F22285|nr:hypothetical protein [uncultured Aquitalea sp.]
MTHTTLPRNGRAAPGLPAATTLRHWAYQSGHLRALELLDTLLTFRDRQEAAPQLQVNADEAVLAGFFDTLRPALDAALPMLTPEERESLLANLQERLLIQADRLMHNNPISRGTP